MVPDLYGSCVLFEADDLRSVFTKLAVHGGITLPGFRKTCVERLLDQFIAAVGGGNQVFFLRCLAVFVDLLPDAFEQDAGVLKDRQNDDPAEW